MGAFDAPDYGPREIPEEGKHTAILYSVVDLGTRNDTYDGVTRQKHEIHVAWELIDTKMADGRPFVVSKKYTVTNGQYGMYFASTSNIFKMLKSWTGLDEKSCKRPALLGKLITEQFPATITIEHQQGKADPSKTYANIESIKPYKGKEKPKQRFNEPIVYEIGDSNFDSLQDWQKKLINECFEKNGGVPAREEKKPVTNLGTGELDDDIPF